MPPIKHAFVTHNLRLSCDLLITDTHFSSSQEQNDLLPALIALIATETGHSRKRLITAFARLPQPFTIARHIPIANASALAMRCADGGAVVHIRYALVPPKE